MGLQRTPLFAAHGAAGAEFTEHEERLVPARFGPIEAELAALREGAGLCDLTYAGVVSLAGPDARRFCNGMFTNNVRDLPVGGGNRSAMVDDRARIQGLLDLYCVEPERFVAVLDGVTPEAFEARYGKYIIFDDVELEDLSGALGVLSVQGPKAGDVLARAGLPVPGGAVPSEAVHVALDALRVARRDRFGTGGFDVIAPREAVPALWEGLLAAGATRVGLQAQEIARIDAGLPRWPVDFGDKALLHEMRLVPTHASFQKGCYIGQEVINRIDVMGQVAKKLWGLEMAEDALPPAGAEVRLGDDVVGHTLSGAREGARVRVLAILRKAAWTSGAEVRVVAGERSVPAVVRDLPFA